jgi:hypothetical protein
LTLIESSGIMCLFVGNLLGELGTFITSNVALWLIN